MDLCQEVHQKRAGKKLSVLAFLTESVFEPILASPATPADVRSRVQATAEAVNAMETAREIIPFYCNAIMNSTHLPTRMKESGVPRFEEVMEEFRKRFSDQWLAGD